MSPAETPESLSPEFGDRVRSAVIWRSGTQILAQIISWTSTLMVVRILAPQDYGLFAMTQVVLVFFSFLAGYGFASALIQSEEIDRTRVRQAFTILLGINILLALGQIAVAPWVAHYYGQPIVSDMLRLQALIYLATPFSVVAEVLMSRDLQFMKPAITNIVSTAIGATVAITMAFHDYGVWTLVVAPIVIFWIRAAMLTYFTGGIIRPIFNFAGAGHMIGFGVAVFAGHVFWIFQSQADIFLAGRMLTPHELGIYAEALFLTQMFASRFVPPLNEVAFPAYAKLQKDRAALGQAFLKAARLILLVAMPVYFGLFAAAPAAIETLFGKQWLEMIPMVKILCLAMPFMTLQILFTPALNAVGKPGVAARISGFGALCMPALFLVGIQWGGVIGLSASWVIAWPTLLAFTWLQANAHVQISGRGLVRAVAPGVVTAAAMALVVMAVDSILPPMAAPARFALLVAVGAGCYVGILYTLMRPVFNEVAQLVLKRKVSGDESPVAA